MPSVQQSFYASATFFAFIASARLPRLMPPKVAKLLHPLIITYFTGTTLFVAQVFYPPPYLHVYIYIYINIHIYVFIYIEREIERQRETERER